MRPTLVLRVLVGIGGLVREIGRLPTYAAEAERLHQEIHRSGSSRRHGLDRPTEIEALDGKPNPFSSGRTEPPLS